MDDQILQFKIGVIDLYLGDGGGVVALRTGSVGGGGGGGPSRGVHHPGAGVLRHVPRGFVTSASEYIAGAKVRLQCKHFDSEEVKHQVEGVTDESGTYRLLLEDDHQEEICEVLLLESPRKDCAEIEGRRDSARVSLTRNNGMASEVRYANPIGFLRDEPLPNCGVLLQQYALGDADD
uniref:Pollen-specific protein C13 n=1 Tax=Ananas comosus var. bracteatus TaxID=296719 RepID=A0A6V7QK35_ANACO|nr:unnamed protein product [Ananas comosus var. bracteatus]